MSQPNPTPDISSASPAEIGISEGFCPECSMPLGLAGVCYTCRMDLSSGEQISVFRKDLEEFAQRLDNALGAFDAGLLSLLHRRALESIALLRGYRIGSEERMRMLEAIIECRWTPVATRPPGVGDLVLLCVRTGSGGLLRIPGYLHIDGQWYSQETLAHLDRAFVTHWAPMMPFPQPPKQEAPPPNTQVLRHKRGAECT